jgi:polyisoprenoid-binding protein YceI
VSLAVSSLSAFGADRYLLDTTHSIPTFEFKHLGATTQSGRFDKASGKVVLDFATHSGSVIYVVDTASLNMGFGTETPQSPGYRLLEVTQFPKITFRAATLIFNRANEIVAAKGHLTMLGVTRPLTVAVHHFQCSQNPLNKKQMCVGEISATIKRSQFGMNAYIPGISDEIDVSVPVEAYKE